MAATLQKQEAQLAAINTLGRAPYAHAAALQEAREDVITLEYATICEGDALVEELLGGAIGASEPVFHVRVRIIADKYDLPRLTKLATIKFAAITKTAWSSPSFAKAAVLVFTDRTSISEELRESVISTVNTHARFLKLDSAGALFLDAMSPAPALAIALWYAQDPGVGAGASSTQEIRYLCPSDCGKSLSSTELSKEMDQVCYRCQSMDFTPSWGTIL
ncbi:hypothetical protein LTR10_002368 [Elasticomyces elasticus]|nr:hypothetical protein LTR10_002368 [Elasticomyces elasticus]KAK4973564.1 hypothetical protein LTR42_005553 [Elasticomyces elasticus]